MRKPEYLSPSALSTYLKDPEQYYIRYLADTRPLRDPQTAAMAIGSAFDAFVKSYLHGHFYGPGHVEAGAYVLRALFEKQVEPQHRDGCWIAGKYLFECYKKSGALADLMLELQSAVDEPRFEFEIRGSIRGSGSDSGVAKTMGQGKSVDVGGMILLGKPDIRFINNEGAHVILDWKVNGFYGKYNKSPMPGYMQLREQVAGGGTWVRRGSHKDVFPIHDRGVMLNGACFLETLDSDWAGQLATYAWLLGEPVGAETIVGIDQIVANNLKTMSDLDGKAWPALRIASHRTKIGQQFQIELLGKYQKLWNLIHEEPFYFFREVSLEDSMGKCALLNDRAQVMYSGDLTVDEAAIMRMCW